MNINNIKMQKQEMVLVIARTGITSNFLPPFQIIIPALCLAAPFSLYTSLKHRIEGDNLYEGLVQNLQKTEGQPLLTQTLRMILLDRKGSNFRVCILGGEKVSWQIALEYKRRGVIIDVACGNLVLNQISYTTGGIAKQLREDDVIRQFLTVFSMSKTLRSVYQTEDNKRITFHIECRYCIFSHHLSESFKTCSVCLATMCQKVASTLQACPRCRIQWDKQFNLQVKKEQGEDLQN